MLEDNGKTNLRVYLFALLFVVGGLIAMAVLPVLAEARVLDDVKKPAGIFGRVGGGFAGAVTFNPIKQGYLDVVRAAQERVRAQSALCVDEFAARNRDAVQRSLSRGFDMANQAAERAQEAKEKEVGAVVLGGVGVLAEHRGQSWTAERLSDEVKIVRDALQSYQDVLDNEAGRRMVCGLGGAVQAVGGVVSQGGEVGEEDFDVVEVGSIDLVQVRDAISSIEEDEQYHPALRVYLGVLKGLVNERIAAGETVRVKTFRKLRFVPAGSAGADGSASR